MTPSRKSSRFGAREDTIDVESAIRQVIARLLTSGNAGLTSAEAESKITEILADLTGAAGVPDPSSSPTPADTAPEIEFSLMLRRGILLENTDGFSPTQLVNTIAPFLNAVIVLQNLLDRFEARSGNPIRISEIRAGPPVRVRMLGVARAVQLVRGVINPWREAHPQWVGSPPGDTAPRRMEHLRTELAQPMLAQVKFGAAFMEMEARLESLLPPLQVLSFGELEIY